MDINSHNVIELVQCTSNNGPGVFKFSGTDTQKLYRKSVKQKTIAPKELTYTLNSSNYRCAELDTIDWQAACPVLGCSNTFGIGVDDTETYAVILNNMIDEPVINLGIPGSGLWANVYNIKALSVYKPKRLVWQLTYNDRITEFRNKQTREISTIGCWTENRRERWLYESINRHEWNIAAYARFAIDYARLLLPETDLYIFNYFDEPGHSMFPELSDIVTVKNVDRARDNRHPGMRTHALTADIIATYFNRNVV